jgi:RNA polymerase sigma-70 factor (ECF subfamily)
MAHTQNLHALLDQTGWIHALARRLVADPHLADDLAQQTWVSALEQEPDGRGPLRGWLATVMRNHLSKARRAEGNRATRERGVSRAEREPGALDVVEKAETHRNLVLAVLALDEPYRSTLLMRFFEQLSYADIARRTGVERSAVNSRITRGLELLRQRLETTYGGDRRALYLALTPLAKLPTGVATTLLGAKLMHVAIGTTALTLVATVTAVGLSRGAREPADAARLLAGAPAQLVPAEPAREPLALPPEPTNAPARSELVVEPVQQKHRKDSDENVWRAQLSQVLAPAATVESVAVNATSGDIELVPSASGRLEIQANVRARISSVQSSELTQVFEDHVDVVEEEGVLRIEDKHRNSNGWGVSFVVGVPARLPASANSGSGDILIRHGQQKVAANTGSGDVKIDLPQGRIVALSANTGSGDVEVQVFSVEKGLNANTGSGDVVVLVTDVASPGKTSLNTGSGDVHLVLPPGVVGSFDLETGSGEIALPRSLGIEVRRVNGGLEAKGQVGSGGGSYALRSGSGTLEVELGNALPVDEDDD